MTGKEALAGSKPSKVNVKAMWERLDKAIAIIWLLWINCLVAESKIKDKKFLRNLKKAMSIAKGFALRTQVFLDCLYNEIFSS